MKTKELIRSILEKNKIGKKISKYVLGETDKFNKYELDSHKWAKTLPDLAEVFKKDENFKNRVYDILLLNSFPEFLFKNESKASLENLAIKYLELNLTTGFDKKFSSKDMKFIVNFLNGVEDKKFEDWANKLSQKKNIQNYWSYSTVGLVKSFWNAGLKNDDVFFYNLTRLSFFMSPVRTFDKLLTLNVDLDQDFEYTFDKLFNKHENAQKLIKDYKLPLYLYLQFLFYLIKSLPWILERNELGFETSEYIKNELERNYELIGKYVESNIDDLTKALKLVDYVSIRIVKRFYDKSPNKFNQMLLEMAPESTSKEMKSFIIDTISQNQKEITAILDLLKSKKKSAREIAIMIFTKNKDKRAKKDIQLLLKTEKNKGILDLIADYLAIV